jgi:hypothetical protein
VWRVAVDTQTLEGNNDGGKLADFVPLTNYRLIDFVLLIRCCSSWSCSFLILVLFSITVYPMLCCMLFTCLNKLHSFINGSCFVWFGRGCELYWDSCPSFSS